MNSEITQSINDSIQEALSIEKHKFVFLGNANTGKTSIISRFMYDSYDPNYQSTIGIDFVSKTCHFGERSMRLQLWDTAGQERFRSLIPSYVRDSTVAILVYDITNEKSFTDITKWYTDVKEQKEDIITILVGNKTDLEDKRVITKEEGIQKANDMHSLYIETSAKNGENVDSIFRKVISKIPQDKKEEIQESTKYIRITTEDMKAASKDLNCQCSHVCFNKQFKIKPY